MNGMEWDGMGWNGMEWDGMGWNGMEWNGMRECMEIGYFGQRPGIPRRLHLLCRGLPQYAWATRRLGYAAAFALAAQLRVLGTGVCF